MQSPDGRGALVAALCIDTYKMTMACYELVSEPLYLYVLAASCVAIVVGSVFPV